MRLHITTLSIFLLPSILDISTKSDAAVLPSEYEEMISPVEIRLISRKKRSIGTGSASAGYDLELDAFDRTHRLKLRSSDHNLFTDSFAYHELGVGADGNLVNKKKRIQKRELDTIRHNIFRDPMAQAVLKVESVQGNLHLDGLVHGMRIRRDEKSGNHSASYKMQKAKMSENDYEKDDRPISVASGRSIATGTISVTVELCIVFDHTNSKTFNFDETQIISYVGLLVNIINNLFTTMEDVTVVFKLAGIFTIKDTKVQPFVENNKKEGKVNSDILFDDFKKWAGVNIDMLPKHDIVTLVFGDEFTGSFGKGTMGGACNISPSEKKTNAVSVGFDSNKNLGGGRVLAHELAHNLNVAHDEDEKYSIAAKCSSTTPSHIMGSGGDENDFANRLRFSTCSSEQLRIFVQSPNAACLYKIDNPAHLPGAGTLGPNPTLDEQCEYYMGKGSVHTLSPEEEKEGRKFVITGSGSGDGSSNILLLGRSRRQQNKKDPNRVCKFLICENKQIEHRLPFVPVENTPCGKNGGKCKNGVCVD